MAPPGGPPPPVPDGWHVSWHDGYNQWFYTNAATGGWQWEHPSGPPPAAQSTPASQSPYSPPAQQPYSDPAQLQDGQPTEPTQGAEFEDGSRGFGHHGGHNVLGTMAGLMTAAGAGALGAKLFGGMKHNNPAAPLPQAQPAYPAWSPGAPNYAGYQGYQGYPAPSPGGSGYPGSPPGQYGYPPQPQAAPYYPASPPSAPVYASQPMLPGGGTPGGSAGGSVASFPAPPPQQGPSPPRLVIHAAAYCDKDVTDRARSRVTPDQVLTIEKMSDEFGDPWPEADIKMLNILYQYGDRPMELLAASSEGGKDKVVLKMEPLANARMAYINKDPGRIICLVWGNTSVLSKERVERLEKEGDLDCSDLGNGGFYPWQVRSLICFYRDANGSIGIGHGRENGTMRLPWNPLAKWS